MRDEGDDRGVTVSDHEPGQDVAARVGGRPAHFGVFAEKAVLKIFLRRGHQAPPRLLP